MSDTLAKVLSKRPVLAGTLYKYTNVVKGWQYRYFMVDELTGFLNYYVTESSKALGDLLLHFGSLFIVSIFQRMVRNRIKRRGDRCTWRGLPSVPATKTRARLQSAVLRGTP